MKHFNWTKRFVALFMLLSVMANLVLAGTRTMEQAKQVAREQMGKSLSRRIMGQGGRTTIDPQLVFVKPRHTAQVDDAYYYVFSAGSDRGYTIVSGDDRFPALIGYTESGDYDADNLPINLANFMQSYQDFVDQATDAQIAELAAWKAQATKHPSVLPFMKSQWNQDNPYNNKCPDYSYYDGFGRVMTVKSVTGCVATAVAQILYYYQYPQQLMADIPAYNYTYTVNNYPNKIQMPSIAAGEVYDWDNMLPVYTGNTTAEQDDAVAKLMLHIGCAVNMVYGPSSSANASVETFTKYFGMDADLIRHLYRADYQIAEWEKMLYEEIAAQRPVYYRGKSTGGGHAFVIHGYENGLYYVNWGWGGYCDGYFDITILNPYSTSGAGASSSDDGYSMDNGMIIGIQPDNGIADEVLYYATIASYSDLTFNVSEIENGEIRGNVTISPQNDCLMDGTVRIGVGYKDDSGEILPVTTSFFELNAQVCPTGYYYSGVSLPCVLSSKENKVYNLFLIEENKNGDGWIACYSADRTSVRVSVQDGRISILPKAQPMLSATATLDIEHSSGYSGFKNSIDVTVKNTGDAEYYDIVYVKVSASANKPVGNTYACGITAPVDGSTTFNFVYVPQTAGTYNVWILDVNNNEIGKSTIVFEDTPPAPLLSFVSIACDNASDDDTIADYNGERVGVKVVYDTKAEFVFKVRNEGGYYEGDFWVGVCDPTTGYFSGPYQRMVFPAGQTSEFRFTVEGNVGDIVGVMLGNNGNNSMIAGLQNPNKHWIYNDWGQMTGAYYYFVDAEICYLAGIPDGLTTLKADTKDDGEYYNLQGVKVTHPAKGIYIKNGKKYLFK